MTLDTDLPPPSAMKAVFTPQSVEIVIDRPKLTLDALEGGSLLALFNSSPEGREQALLMAEDWSKNEH